MVDRERLELSSLRCKRRIIPRILTAHIEFPLSEQRTILQSLEPDVLLGALYGTCPYLLIRLQQVSVFLDISQGLLPIHL